MEKTGAKPAFLATLGVGISKGVGVEGMTESAQEGTSILAERIIKENWDALTSDEMNRLVESGVRGATVGGVFGGTGGTRTYLRKRNTPEEIEKKQNKAVVDNEKKGVENTIDEIVGEEEVGFLNKQFEENTALLPELESQLSELQELEATELEKDPTGLSEETIELKRKIKDVKKQIGEAKKAIKNSERAFAFNEKYKGDSEKLGSTKFRDQFDIDYDLEQLYSSIENTVGDFIGAFTKAGHTKGVIPKGLSDIKIKDLDPDQAKSLLENLNKRMEDIAEKQDTPIGDKLIKHYIALKNNDVFKFIKEQSEKVIKEPVKEEKKKSLKPDEA